MSFTSQLEFQPSDEFNDIRKKLAQDKNKDLIDVSAGVYRDDTGKSFTLPVIMEAKSVLYHSNNGHDYNFCLGIPEFLKAAATIFAGTKTVEEGRISSCQTVGGTGACHLGAMFLTQRCGLNRYYLGTPAWPNYIPLLKQVGADIVTYSYYNYDTHSVDFESIIKTLKEAPKDSIFVLQLCCHNPTGSDLDRDQWSQVAQIMKSRSLIPFFDGAYQGLSTGSLEEDVWPVRMFIELGIELLYCQSFSKCLGLYGERVGCLHIVVNDKSNEAVASDQLRYLFRSECSSAPAFGAQLMSIISSTPSLLFQWKKDLENMAARLIKTREEMYRIITQELKTPGDWNHLKKQKGLFWFSGLTPDQCKIMSNEFHIYLPINGRINIAGVNSNNIYRFCKSFDEVVRNSS